MIININKILYDNLFSYFHEYKHTQMYTLITVSKVLLYIWECSL